MVQRDQVVMPSVLIVIICLRTSAPRSTRHTIAIAIEVAVPLPEQLLGEGKGADLRASVGMAAWPG